MPQIREEFTPAPAAPAAQLDDLDTMPEGLPSLAELDATGAATPPARCPAGAAVGLIDGPRCTACGAHTTITSDGLCDACAIARARTPESYKPSDADLLRIVRERPCVSLRELAAITWPGLPWTCKGGGGDSARDRHRPSLGALTAAAWLREHLQELVILGPLHFVHRRDEADMEAQIGYVDPIHGKALSQPRPGRSQIRRLAQGGHSLPELLAVLVVLAIVALVLACRRPSAPRPVPGRVEHLDTRPPGYDRIERPWADDRKVHRQPGRPDGGQP